MEWQCVCMSCRSNMERKLVRGDCVLLHRHDPDERRTLRGRQHITCGKYTNYNRSSLRRSEVRIHVQ